MKFSFNAIKSAMVYNEKFSLKSNTLFMVNIFFIIFSTVITFSYLKSCFIYDYDKTIIILVLFFIGSIGITELLVDYKMKNTPFCEWDKKERKKKKSLFHGLSIIDLMLIWLFITNGYNIYNCIEYGLKKTGYSILILSTASLIFLFNALFDINLLYPLFKDIIKEEEITEKPDNWEE